MELASRSINRRTLLSAGVALGGTSLFTPGVFAELLQTAPLTEGPFYPDKLPLDTDNDLLVINDSITPAVGEITYMTGKVTTPAGSPLRNAFVEIWQVDNNAVYLHSADKTNRENQDKNFQGYGRFMTDASGQYHFRTIKPVPYPGRTPHIHVAVSHNGERLLTTQLLIKGHEQNARDGVIRGLKDKPETLATIMGDFKPVADAPAKSWSVNFDLVLGKTAAEDESGKLKGGIGRSRWQ